MAAFLAVVIVAAGLLSLSQGTMCVCALLERCMTSNALSAAPATLRPLLPAGASAAAPALLPGRKWITLDDVGSPCARETMHYA